MYYWCPRCNGIKQAPQKDDDGNWSWITCPLCSGRGWITEEEKAAVDMIVSQVSRGVNRAFEKFGERMNSYFEKFKERLS